VVGGTCCEVWGSAAAREGAWVGSALLHILGSGAHPRTLSVWEYICVRGQHLLAAPAAQLIRLKFQLIRLKLELS